MNDAMIAFLGVLTGTLLAKLTTEISSRALLHNPTHDKTTRYDEELKSLLVELKETLDEIEKNLEGRRYD